MHFVIYDLTSGRITQTGIVDSIEQAPSYEAGQGILMLEHLVSVDHFFVNVSDKTLVKFPDKPMNVAVWDWKSYCWQTPEEVESAKTKKWQEAKASRNNAVAVLPRSRDKYYEKLNAVYDSIANIRQQIVLSKTVSEVESISCKI